MSISVSISLSFSPFSSGFPWVPLPSLSTYLPVSEPFFFHFQNLSSPPLPPSPLLISAPEFTLKALCSVSGTHSPHSLPCRMLQLSVSWLGLETVAASPWLLLLLVGASWLMSRVLVWTYAAYNYSRHLQSFPQPPKRNWFLGHLGLVSLQGQGGWTSRMNPRSWAGVWYSRE